jgi:hypothetical protein
VDARVLLDNNGFLSVIDAATLRVRDGKILITDGSFAETHEQLGSSVLVDCQDLDEALHWAAKLPAAKTGSIKVPPLWSQRSEPGDRTTA